MKKQIGNIAVYVLAIALVVASAINANQAQSHSRDTAKIRMLEREIESLRSLEGQIESLRSCLNSNLEDVSRLLSRGSDNWRYIRSRC
jgi:hypothetical protein